MIIIDNYDSFTYNIVQYIKMIGIEPKIFKNDEIEISELKKLDFSSIILSPGPGAPDDAGITPKVIAEFYKSKAILGVCLGHQCIAKFFGAKIVKDEYPVHGKCSNVYFKHNEALFKGFEQGFLAMRYHSLKIDTCSVNPPLKSLAYMDRVVVAAIKHVDYDVYGVQFHPESVLTFNGINIFKNFLKIASGSKNLQNK